MRRQTPREPSGEDFVRGRGVSFLAHLLKRLHDEFVRGFEAWNSNIGLIAPPRTHSTMLALERHGALGVTELAGMLRQSHPLIITWIRQLRQLGLIESVSDPADGRRSLIRLTKAGDEEVLRMKAADRVVEQTYRQLMKDADADIFEALWRLEQACRRQPFHERLMSKTKDMDFRLEAPGTGQERV